VIVPRRPPKLEFLLAQDDAILQGNLNLQRIFMKTVTLSPPASSPSGKPKIGNFESVRQSVLSQALEAICAQITGLARHVRNIRDLVTAPQSAEAEARESMEDLMKTGTTLVTTLFALASFPLVAQQPPPAGQPTRPATQQTPSGTEQVSPNSPAATPQTPAAVELSPVNGELLSKLDSKTAKTGDSVVVQTKSAVKTAEGTEIPKGSKLVGHVLAAKPSGAGENSQVALQFDHFELKGGQNLPVHSQIQSIAPAGGAASASASGAMSEPTSGGSSNPSTSGSNAGSTASGAPQTTGASSGAAAAANTAPAAGTVVARTGNIAIETTSVPGVLLANNAPGQQDPRMAQASSILLGAKQDIQLEGGTKMVLGVTAASGGTQ
jgi:hypothetical protein